MLKLLIQPYLQYSFTIHLIYDINIKYHHHHYKHLWVDKQINVLDHFPID